MKDKLEEYKSKRNFEVTSEPRPTKLIFVVQKHQSLHPHYDLRLEWEGVLKSWAIPKSIPLTTKVKRLAIQVEDHPLEYALFEGVIPKGEYGAGEVTVWDKGSWEPLVDPASGFKGGKLVVRISGKKLSGDYVLIKLKSPHQWLIFRR